MAAMQNTEAEYLTRHFERKNQTYESAHYVIPLQSPEKVGLISARSQDG